MENCPQTEKCPLFQGEILVSKVAQEIYMNLYCSNDVQGRNRCKRFMLSNKLKTPVSVEVMPNDERSLDELIQRYQK